MASGFVEGGHRVLNDVVVSGVRRVSSAATSSLVSVAGGLAKKAIGSIVNLVAHVGAGLLGAANAWSSNQVLGAGRVDAAAQGLTDSKGVAFQIGQKFGDAVSIFTGGLEIGASAAGEIVSLGIATPVAIPVAAHGATAVGMGVCHLLNGRIVYSTGSEGSNGGGSSSSSQPKYNTPQEQYPGVAKDYSGKSAPELKRAIRSTKKTIAEHEGWLANPSSKPEVGLEKWKNMLPQAREGLLNKWRKDITRNKAYLKIAEDALKAKN